MSSIFAGSSSCGEVLLLLAGLCRALRRPRRRGPRRPRRCRGAPSSAHPHPAWKTDRWTLPSPTCPQPTIHDPVACAMSCTSFIRPDDPGGDLDGDRRRQRRGQDDPGQAALPALRPAGGRGDDRRRRHARPRRRRVPVAGGGRLPGLRPLRAAAARQRRAARRARRRRSRPRSPAPGRPAGRAGHRAGSGYEGGTDLSGGQWQRVALARALAAVRQGAGLVLLDEPTAQLDVRGEAEIFSRILAATRGVHDDPHLAPVLDGAPGRPDLRARARPGRRAGLARRADGPGRSLPRRCSTCRRRASTTSTSGERRSSMSPESLD